MVRKHLVPYCCLSFLCYHLLKLLNSRLFFFEDFLVVIWQLMVLIDRKQTRERQGNHNLALEWCQRGCGHSKMEMGACFKMNKTSQIYQKRLFVKLLATSIRRHCRLYIKIDKVIAPLVVGCSIGPKPHLLLYFRRHMSQTKKTPQRIFFASIMWFHSVLMVDFSDHAMSDSWTRLWIGPCCPLTSINVDHKMSRIAAVFCWWRDLDTESRSVLLRLSLFREPILWWFARLRSHFVLCFGCFIRLLWMTLLQKCLFFLVKGRKWLLG